MYAVGRESLDDAGTDLCPDSPIVHDPTVSNYTGVDGHAVGVAGDR
jgi:hypothetical protein